MAARAAMETARAARGRGIRLKDAHIAVSAPRCALNVREVREVVGPKVSPIVLAAVIDGQTVSRVGRHALRSCPKVHPACQGARCACVSGGMRGVMVRALLGRAGVHCACDGWARLLEATGGRVQLSVELWKNVVAPQWMLRSQRSWQVWGVEGFIC